MTKPFPWGRRIGLLLLLPVGLLPLLLAGPRAAQPVQPQSRFHDWTTHHVVYPHMGTLGALRAVESDPRARFRWREVEQRELAQSQQRRFADFWRRPRFPRRPSSDLHRDWSVSLGGGTTAAGQYPAKFTFDTTAAVTLANCSSDFAVFPINVAGTATQANIAALNNLYSGTANGFTPNGLCNTVLAATVTWAYNVDGIGGAATTKTNTGGAVPTSPVLSLDGTKVAFVESATGSAARFHVVAPASEGTVGAPIIFGGSTGRAFSATAPVASGGNGAATDLALGSSTSGTDTLSSPYIDYARDTAYVGNDAGVLFRLKNVFCTTVSCGNAAPSLDTTWGGTGSVNVPCAAKLTGPVQDFPTGNVFVGCADGKVYGFNSTGAALTTASIAIGDGSANGDVVESPVVDPVNGLIYAVSGTGAAPNTGSAVLVQATTSLGGPCTGGTLCVATVGNPNVHSAHAPALNDNYFSSGTSTGWLLYMGGFTGGTSANLTLYGATFSGTRVMTTGTPGNAQVIGNRPGEYAPLTEFKNGANDLLFIGVIVNLTDMAVMNINAFPTAAPTTTAMEGLGISGMVVDNSSGSAQASSIYFGTLGTTAQGGNNAVKLTQSGLQ